jgi:hypothetical protein
MKRLLCWIGIHKPLIREIHQTAEYNGDKEYQTAIIYRCACGHNWLGAYGELPTHFIIPTKFWKEGEV